MSIAEERLHRPGWILGTLETCRGAGLDGSTKGSNVAVMFLQGTGKTVVAIAIRHKVVEVRNGGMHGCFQRTAAWIPNRTGRQTDVPVGVIGRVDLHVRMMQSTAVSAIQQFGIDNAGVGIQAHVLRQTVVIDTGYHWTLFGHSCFLLDNRCHCYEAVHVSAEPETGGFLSKALHHQTDDVLQSLSSGELIGVWEKI